MAIISIVKGDIISDHTVVVDGRGIQFDLTTFIVDATFYALQWKDVIGERENLDGTVAVVNSLTPYQAALDEWAVLAAAEDALEPTPFEIATQSKMGEIDQKARQQLSADVSTFTFWEFFLDYQDFINPAVLEGAAVANIITYRSVVDEADAWFADNLTPTPLIDLVLAESGELKNAFVVDLRAFRDAADISLVRIFSRRREYVRALRVAADIPAVNAIIVDYS